MQLALYMILHDRFPASEPARHYSDPGPSLTHATVTARIRATNHCGIIMMINSNVMIMINLNINFKNDSH
jgi:hypothetical protein